LHQGWRAAFPIEVLAVWALFAIVALEILVTYWRLPAHELYNVSGSGFRGGTSRVLVFLNYPLALVAIPIIVFVAERLRSRASWITAAVGVALSAAIFWPGIVKEADLDARPVNAVAALGVLVTASLTVIAARKLEPPARPVRQTGDWLRVIVSAVTLVLGIPWMAADLGLFFNHVPVLGTLYQTGELRTQPHSIEVHPAVHHGHHHGMDGVLLVLAALLLSRLLASVGAKWLRWTLGAYLALMLCYGAGNIANDFWLEQVAKRGWTEWLIPDVTTPKASVAWGVIVIGAAALWAASLWRTRRLQASPVSSRPET
jgi:hypothetical protein